MASSPFDFNTGSVDFVGGVEDGLLDMDTAMPDLTPELPSQDVGDLTSAAVPVLRQSDDDACDDTEDTLIALLSQGRKADILALTGELPDTLATISSDVSEEFAAMYARAAAVRPSLRWYGKFAKLLPTEAFHVAGENLQLKISKDLFKRAVRPFLADFPSSHAASSPLVSVVRSIAASYDGASLAASEKRMAGDVRTSGRAEASDFDPAEVDFTAADDDDAILADLGIEDDLFGTPEMTASQDAAANLNLADLSNKAVAQYCHSAGLEDDEISDELQSQGFATARANEVASIVAFMRKDKARHARASGNRGTGSVDFDFGL